MITEKKRKENAENLSEVHKKVRRVYNCLMKFPVILPTVLLDIMSNKLLNVILRQLQFKL